MMTMTCTFGWYGVVKLTKAADALARALLLAKSSFFQNRTSIVLPGNFTEYSLTTTMAESGNELNEVTQPKRKKRRIEQVMDVLNFRTLKLDLSKCPGWVRTQSNEELFNVFKIGVAVKDSITMEVTGGKRNFDQVLGQIEQTKTALEQRIDQLLPSLQNYRDTLLQMASKPTSIGLVGELDVLSVLKEGLPNHTVKDVSKTKGGRCGDIHVTSAVSGQKHMLEVKTHSNSVPASEIVKFENNLRDNKHIKVGILLSLDSTIAMRAKHGKFEITYDDKQYFIYVPNARKEENLIVWSVLLADELAALDGELTDGQTQELLKLQRKFHENMDKTKACRCKFNSLKEMVDDLEANLMPLLDIIDGAKTDLNKALHQRGKLPFRQKKNIAFPDLQKKIAEYFPVVHPYKTQEASGTV